MTVLVRFADVTKRYRRGAEVVTAVDRVTFDVVAGTITALIGPSGSGKTTILNLVVGGDEPDEGVIECGPARGDWSQLAIVPQQLGLLAELTMGENVALPERFGTSLMSDPADVMAQLLIDDLADRPPAETSLGEQQRAAVARALVTAPDLLVVDEPTSHQDEENTLRVIAALVDLAEKGSGVLVATHDRRIVDRCDRVLHLADGELTVGSDDGGQASLSSS